MIVQPKGAIDRKPRDPAAKPPPGVRAVRRLPRVLLLHFRVSHYNEKVRWALDFKNWPHRRRAMLPGFHIPEVRLRTGQQQVPVVQLDQEPWLCGSAQIIEELERRRPAPSLYPADTAQRERALALQQFFDDEAAPDIRRLFWHCYLPHPELTTAVACDGFPAITRPLWRASLPLIRRVMSGNLGLTPEQIERAQARLPEYFDRIVAELQPSGYLCGEAFSLADLAVASIMSGIVRPPEFPYPLPEPWPPELMALRGKYADHPGFRWVMEMYARHRGRSTEMR